jgi:hypothetical protein
MGADGLGSGGNGKVKDWNDGMVEGGVELEGNDKDENEKEGEGLRLRLEIKKGGGDPRTGRDVVTRSVLPRFFSR